MQSLTSNEILASSNTATVPSKTNLSPSVWIVAGAFLALVLKLSIALNTLGTNDAYFFNLFARDIAEHGLQWTYAHRPMFNHPPLTAYYLKGIYAFQNFFVLGDASVTFAFLLRLPGILADFVVVLTVLKLADAWRLSTRALMLFALSPVSLMVSGFHGNTDSVVTMLVVTAAYMCVRNRPVLCGILLAFSCGIKIVPLFLLPIFFFFWWVRRRALFFGLPLMTVLAATSIEALLSFPGLFAKNVLGYGSYWGHWGISYWLRLTGWSEFAVCNFRNLPLAETVVSTTLKLFVVIAVFFIAWRRRNMDGRALFASIGYAWLVFFIFAPGIAPQYFVWLMPFILILSESAFLYVTLASSCFLFFLYNTIAAGLPWNLAVSTNAIADRWAPWTVWPWLAFIAALAIEWKRDQQRDPSLQPLSPNSA